MKYSNQEKQLLLEFADASDELLSIGVISTDSFTGEIGEYFACKAYNLKKSNRVNPGFDGVCAIGNRYQVKAKILKDSFGYSFTGLKTQYFEYLIVVYLNKNYSPEKIIKIPKSKIISENFAISNSNLHLFENYDLKKLRVSGTVMDRINRFATIYNTLIERKIIRSRRIVGDIGEYYAAERLGLKLELNKNSKGFDATDDKGITYEIKTRRVYDSERRISERRRVNGLVGKTANYLIVVTLDRKFLCSGMWIMPLANINNPKSATLEIVNNTPGVENLVPSAISYLRSGEPNKGFSRKKADIVKKRKKITKAPSRPLPIKVKRSVAKPKKAVKDELFFTRYEKITAVVLIIIFGFLILISI